MNLLPPSLCIKINTNGYNIAFVYTELTKLCKNPVKLSLKYYINSLGGKKGKSGEVCLCRTFLFSRYLKSCTVYWKNLLQYPCTKINSTINGMTYVTYTRTWRGNFTPFPSFASLRKFSNPHPYRLVQNIR